MPIGFRFSFLSTPEPPKAPHHPLNTSHNKTSKKIESFRSGHLSYKPEEQWKRFGKSTEAEANELLNKYREEAASEHDASLEANKKTLKELRKTVEKCFDKAVNTVFDAVLGTIKV